MAVPLTQFLLLLEITCSFPSCEILACCDALGNGADPQRKETLSVNVTAINNASVKVEDWKSACAVDDFGQCCTVVYEPWDLGSTFGLQKARIATALLGRGTGAAMAVPLTQFVLLLQVSDLLPRQKSVFALPVPPQVVYDSIKKQASLRPRSRCCFSLLRRTSFYFLLVICCGDVELNPGPDKLQLVLDGQAVINTKLDNIEAKQVAQSLALDDLKKRMSTLESKIAAFSNLEAVVNECKKSCDSQEHAIDGLRSKLDELENRSRRCNLVFYSIKDVDPKEPWSTSEKHIRELSAAKFNLELKTIETAHRLGKFHPDKKRPLIVNFASFKEKQAISENAKKLKGSGISVSEDFSESMRRKRRILWEFAQSRKSDDSRVNLRLDVLHLDNVKYVYDEEINQVVKLK